MGEGDKGVMSSLEGGKGVKRKSGDSTRELSRLSHLAGKMFIASPHAVPLPVECQREKRGGGGGGGAGGGGGGRGGFSQK